MEMAKDKPKSLVVKKKELTDEQKVQHTSVLKSASHNLNLVIDQIESLDNTKYDEVLECLDSAKIALENI